MIGAPLGSTDATAPDMIQPFQLDIPALSGRLVRLGPLAGRDHIPPRLSVRRRPIAGGNHCPQPSLSPVS